MGRFRRKLSQKRSENRENITRNWIPNSPKEIDHNTIKNQHLTRSRMGRNEWSSILPSRSSSDFIRNAKENNIAKILHTKNNRICPQKMGIYSQNSPSGKITRTDNKAFSMVDKSVKKHGELLGPTMIQDFSKSTLKLLQLLLVF